MNVSQETFHGVDALIDRLATALDPARCTLYFARVGDVGVGYANSLLHTGELSAAFTRWQRRALDLGFTVNRPGGRKTCVTCGHADGRYGAVVSADGTLASCWETAGETRLGGRHGRRRLPAQRGDRRPLDRLPGPLQLRRGRPYARQVP